MRIYFRLFFLLALLSAGCAPQQKQLSKHTPPKFFSSLPAVFHADLPLKKYPPASFELVLRPRGMYFLQMKRKAPADTAVQAEIGMWRYDQKQKILRLTGYDKAVRVFRLTGKRTLKLLKISGGMMPSVTGYPFILTDKKPRYDGAVRMRGMYSRKRGRGVLQECLSREKFPLLSQGAADIKKAYQNILHGRSESLFVLLDVRISSRAGRGDRLVPARSRAVNIDPYRSCKGKRRRIATITDKRWYLIELAGRAAKPEQMNKKTLPFLKVQRGDQLIQGFAGCNNFTGSWLFTDNDFIFSRIKATRMACPVGMEVEDAFLRALDNTRGYTIRGNILSLRDQKGRVLARLRYSRKLNDLDFRYLSSESEDAETVGYLSEETVVSGGAVPSFVAAEVAEESKKERSTPSGSAHIHTRKKKIKILKARQKKIAVSSISRTTAQAAPQPAHPGEVAGEAGQTVPLPKTSEAPVENKPDTDNSAPSISFSDKNKNKNKITEPEAERKQSAEDVIEQPLPQSSEEQELAPSPASSPVPEPAEQQEAESASVSSVIANKNQTRPEAEDKKNPAGDMDSPESQNNNVREIAGAQDFSPQTQGGQERISASSCNRPWKTPLARITGQITKVDIKSPPWTSERGLHLEVESSSGISYLIHVFPEKLMEQCRELFDFKAGEKVAVSGSEFRTGGNQGNICAATITRGSDVLRLREPATSSLENQVCCLSLCEKKCGNMPRPEMCRKGCSSQCQDTMRAR
ncbi:MAG: META domain-containing protein [Candidatus Electrothrix sp. EH2]|nr:META domain-containing protein [Candidatus Electrothrix sp. EH2]